MTIDDHENLIIKIDGRTKLISKQQIIKAFAEPKASCANYERDYEEFSKITEEDLKRPIFGKIDPIVESVRTKLLDRSQVGVKKYGTTLKNNTKDNYLNHLQMELMDACNYLEVLLQQNTDITDIVKNEPNDLELGKKIRKIYGSKD